MWHVPTLMPYFNHDDQQVINNLFFYAFPSLNFSNLFLDIQLERKKQVGNDRAVIVFREEGGDPIPPNTISSKAILLFFLIQPFTKDGEIYYKYNIPPFSPSFPSSSPTNLFIYLK